MPILRCGLVLGSLLAAVALSGFEQGTYFLIDLVEDGDAAPAAGRIAVEASLLKSVDAEGSEAVGAAESEFFIGLGAEQPTTQGSAFEVPGMNFGVGDTEEEESFGGFSTETEPNSNPTFSFE